MREKPELMNEWSSRSSTSGERKIELEVAIDTRDAIRTVANALKEIKMLIVGMKLF